MSHSKTARIARNAIMLALLCVVGMFSIPFGENVKVSLQLLMVMLVILTAEAVWDALIVTSCYLLMGLFLPVYAGFSVGITPTFGYVISFVVICPVLFYLNRLPKLPSLVRMIIACLVSLILVYTIGTIFMMAYLGNWDLGKILLVSVVPYLPFDALKILLVIVLVKMLPSFIVNRPKKWVKEDKKEKESQEK